MVISAIMMAQARNNSWSELLTSMLQREPPGLRWSQRYSSSWAKASNLAQNRRWWPVM